MVHLKNHTRTALVYFVLAAFLGCVLRFFRVLEIPVTYKFIVHTHSHIALLGWVYMALTTLLYKLYLSKSGVDKKYNRIYWFTQLTMVGMLLTFPFQGYAFFSIVFSTLFLFASYWFSWFFYRNIPANLKSSKSIRCAMAAIFYLLISSIGPWALGAIMSILGSESVWYRLAIYFYLHFLYNGWMMMALVAIFIFILEKHRINIPTNKFNRFFWFLNIGIVLSFLLSTLFAEPTMAFYIFGGIGAVLQLLAFYDLLQFIMGVRKQFTALFSRFHQNTLKLVVVLWGIKMLLQLLTAIPYFTHLTVTYLDFTIGYLHWTFLGVVTISLMLFLNRCKLLILNKGFFYLYVVGFAFTETLIFYKAITSWLSTPLFSSYYLILALSSTLILVALFGLWIKNKPNTILNKT